MHEKVYGDMSKILDSIRKLYIKYRVFKGTIIKIVYTLG